MESKEFSSIFDLAENFLSQKSKNTATNGVNNTTDIHHRSVSESLLSSKQDPKASSSDHDRPINIVLKQQIENMLKAKERQKQTLAEELEKLKVDCDNDNNIDLAPYILHPNKQEYVFKEVPLKRSSSYETLCETNFHKFTAVEKKDVYIKPGQIKYADFPHIYDFNYMIHDKQWNGKDSSFNELPQVHDLSYIKQKRLRSKRSSFGKVLTSRYRPVCPHFQREIMKNLNSVEMETGPPLDI